MANIQFKVERGRRFGTLKGTFVKDARGVSIVLSHDLPPAKPAEHEFAPNTQTDWNMLCTPDKEYRWCQTIDTNVPLGGVTNPYVDPRPSDDPGTPKPFYWTDAEHATLAPRFSDGPKRGVPAVTKTTWRATLSLCAVNGKSVVRIGTVYYGFDLDSAGTVTPVKPTLATDPQIKTHVATLKGEFASYTFT
ncbi:MAG: hypothetical protein Q9O74_06695 [Planctomycetota bacterium]|nr:hypothetical protein [Planctomycetota bacterium]